MSYFEVSKFFRFVIGPSTAAELEAALGVAANKVLFNQMLMDLEYSHRLIYDLPAMAKMGSSTTAVAEILNTRNVFINLIDAVLVTYDAAATDFGTPAHRYGVLKLVGGTAFGPYVAAVSNRANLFVQNFPGVFGYAMKSKAFVNAFKVDQTKWGYLAQVTNTVRVAVLAGTIKSWQALGQVTLTAGTATASAAGAYSVAMTYSLTSATTGVYNISNLNFPSSVQTNVNLTQPAASVNNPGPGSSRLGYFLPQAQAASGATSPTASYQWVSGGTATMYIGGFISTED